MQVLDTNNYVTIDGAIHHNSGKSVGCVMALLLNACQQEPDANGKRRTRYAIIRNTNRMLEDTTIKTVHEWIPPGQAGKWRSTSKNFNIRFKLPDNTTVESEWQFRALDNPDDVRNLLSLEITGAWINEYREIRNDVFVNLIGRLGRFPRKADGGATSRILVMDTNPPPLMSFWYNLFEVEPSPEVQAAMAALATDRPLLELFRQPSGRSPEAENIENLPDDYYQTLIALNADEGQDWVSVHVDGEYGPDPSGLPVFPEFRPSLHVATEPLNANPLLPLAVGVDFGRTPAMLFAQQNTNGQWVILKEFYKENTGMEGFLEAAIPWARGQFPDHLPSDWLVWADPAGQHKSQADDKTCYEVMRAFGLRPRAGAQTLEARLGGVRRVLTRLVDGRPGMIVDKSCRLYIQGMAGQYMFARNREGESQPLPKKNKWSHVNDAGQHLIGAYEAGEMRGRERRRFEKGQARKPVIVRDRWAVL